MNIINSPYMQANVVFYVLAATRPEDIMLKNLMIILFFHSHQYQQLFLHNSRMP